jgi:hypothetical protein
VFRTTRARGCTPARIRLATGRLATLRATPRARGVARTVGAGPVVTEQPGHWNVKAPGDHEDGVHGCGRGSQFSAVDGLPVYAGPFGEAWLPKVAPVAETTDPTADLGSVGEDPWVGRFGRSTHPFTLDGA